MDHWFGVLIPALNKAGNMIAQFDQKDMFPLNLSENQSWTETIYLSSNTKQRINWEKLGLRLLVRTENQNHHLYRILAPKTDKLDWWTTRLLLPLNKQCL